MKEYTVDVTGYGHVSTTKITAASPQEAIQKAHERYGITVVIRSERTS